MTDRPPYRVPSMADVAATRGTNGYTVASTFSGCGGSCLGFEMAGYRIGFASEFIEEARNTYALNHPGVIIDPRDIRDVSAEDIMRSCGVNPGELDVLEGSPPCASFSVAGGRERLWGKVKKYSDTEQRADDLFFEFIRLVSGCQPKVFIAENVPGLTIGTARGYFREIHRGLAAAGYRVEARILDAQWLGVPQRRRRVIFQGVREDVIDSDGAPIIPAWPDPLPYSYTVADAIEEAARGSGSNDTGTGRHFAVIEKDGFGPEVGTASTWVVNAGPVSTVKASGGIGASIAGVTAPPVQCDTEGRAVDPETGARIDLRGTAIYRDWCKRTNRRYQQSIVAEKGAASPTVTGAAGSRGTAGVMLGDEPRKFTLGELRAVCGFPADFALTGSYAQRWERLGRAVPPLMMRAVAQAVQTGVLDRIA